MFVRLLLFFVKGPFLFLYCVQLLLPSLLYIQYICLHSKFPRGTFSQDVSKSQVRCQQSSMPLKDVNILAKNVFSTGFLPLQGMPYKYLLLLSCRPRCSSVHKHIISSLILASLKKVIAWPTKPQLVLLVQKQPSSCLQSVLLVSFVTIWRSKRAVTTWLLGPLPTGKGQVICRWKI